MYIYCLISGNGDVIKASHDEEAMEYLRENIENNNYAEAAEELGLDVSDLSERESAEVAFKAGYDNGSPYIVRFKQDVLDEEYEVETDNGDVLSTSEILDALID